jgi:hypothetical protein
MTCVDIFMRDFAEISSKLGLGAHGKAIGFGGGDWQSTNLGINWII